jgi:hypothetical protein
MVLHFFSLTMYFQTFLSILEFTVESNAIVFECLLPGYFRYTKNKQSSLAPCSNWHLVPFTKDINIDNWLTFKVKSYNYDISINHSGWCLLIHSNVFLAIIYSLGYIRYQKQAVISFAMD